MSIHDVTPTGRRQPGASSPRPKQPRAAPGSAAVLLAPVVDSFFPKGSPVRIECWDGSALGSSTSLGRVRIDDPVALRHLIWAPGELGLGRAFVTGAIDIDGDIIGVLDALEHTSVDTKVPLRAPLRALSAAWSLGVIGGRPRPPAAEARTTGRRHSIARDRQAIHHHYDVGNDFYSLVLGPTMTYSCARFTAPDTTLEQAQHAKFELVCRKLGLDAAPGARLLDVGCGWGSLAIHAARTYGAHVVGISISEEQVRLARERVVAAGVADLVEIRLQDYRTLDGEQFDAISSVGMFEHVGTKRMGEYFEVLRSLLGARGRLLNHAISSVGSSSPGPRSFIGRYVFPDGELIDIADVVGAMERAGFEVRDVESLREHYATTLRAWVQNLEGHWDRAVELVGEERARVWRLYMAASAVGFTDAGISIYQTLGVLDDELGGSGMPRTRAPFAV